MDYLKEFKDKYYEAVNPTYSGMQPGEARPGVFGEGGYLQRWAVESSRQRLAPKVEKDPSLDLPRAPQTPTAAGSEYAYVDNDVPDNRGGRAGAPLPERGPLESAAARDGITRDGNSFSGTGTAVDVPSSAPTSMGDLAAAYGRADRASADQAAQEAFNRNYAGNRALQASEDLRTAQRNADVSRFRATNGADMVLAPENSGYDMQRKAIIDAAAQDQRRVDAAQNRLTTAENAIGGTRDYVNEYVKSQEEINRANLASSAAQRAPLAAEEKRLALEQQKRINQTSDALLKAKTPEDARALQNKLLALMGKDKPGEFTIAKLEGKKTVTPMGETKEPDQLVLVNARDGSATLINTTPQGEAADPITRFKAMRPSDAKQEALKYVKEHPERKDQVNELLKNAGHEVLD